MLKNLYKNSILKALKAMQHGRLQLVLPDGTRMEIGQSDEVKAHLQMKSDQVWKRIALFGDIGFAEAYMENEWETDDLTNLLKFFLLNIEHTPGVSGSETRILLMNMLQWANKLTHQKKQNTRVGSKKNIRAHYDLSNDFFALFLDGTMTYSSGLFHAKEEALEQAQYNKYDSLCQQAGIQKGDHVLEIGTGWGGFALHAAGKYGARVSSVTISKEQHDYACNKVKDAGLEDLIDIQLKDYRDIQGTYDKVVSIEMIEAVGAKFLNTYFKKIHDILKPDGVLALQAIICPDNRFDLLKKRVDFIQKHIFPGSLLPSISAINQSVNATGDLFLFGLKDMGKSYVRTLEAWKASFNHELLQIREMGFDETFIRKWNYYFSYCEAAFDMRNINVVQMIYTRPNNFSFGH
jgi:cyclopropane-fatty-acyl-phospholipid synthase